MSEELETVSTHANIVEAEMAKSMLESAGIEAYIHAPHSNALYPGLLGDIKLQVKAADLQKAQDALEEGTVLEEDEDD